MKLYVVIAKVYMGMGMSHPAAILVTGDKDKAWACANAIEEKHGKGKVIDIQERELEVDMSAYVE